MTTTDKVDAFLARHAARITFPAETLMTQEGWSDLDALDREFDPDYTPRKKPVWLADDGNEMQRMLRQIFDRGYVEVKIHLPTGGDLPEAAFRYGRRTTRIRGSVLRLNYEPVPYDDEFVQDFAARWRDGRAAVGSALANDLVDEDQN